MKIKKIALSIILSASALTSYTMNASEHPSLALTKSGVEDIRQNLGSIPLFDKSLAKVKRSVDKEILAGISVPIPKDYSGGYTHQQHKRNFFTMQKAGALYQILNDDTYAKFIKDMLFEYEAMYKTLPIHPKPRSYARGKLFWQCLNDANWLVYTAQAYDAIYDYLTPQERTTLEDNLFRPFADHISVDNPKFFNRIHNHSTWGTAAVGMIGLAMRDEELINRALYGIPLDSLDLTAKDNDGGFIYDKDNKAGFLANLAEPFSPDGYYNEGPYYQRYAMSPFLIFAQALHNVKPDLKIFEQQNGVLPNAVNTLLNLTDADGEFFALNDGQKGMSYHAGSLVTAVNIAYLADDSNSSLLSVAQEQGRVNLDDAGFVVALNTSKGKATDFVKTSVNYSDGPQGKQGGVAVLRDNAQEMDVVFKYTSQGLGHGHYDKLSFSYHQSGEEILQDYGMSRFVNIGQKGGGNYLKENGTWAKQTIAHNTLVLNERSHFNGKYKTASQHHSDLHFYDDSNASIKIVSGKELNAYPGNELHRTMALITHDKLEHPYLVDIFKVSADDKHQYDLPFYYFGQIIDSNFEYKRPNSLEPLGKKHGYQHLYLEGKGNAHASNTKFSWMNNMQFHTLTAVTNSNDDVLLTRIGANDPNFNLRAEPALILRRNDSDTTFVSVIETHGSYSPVSERATNTSSSVINVEVIYDDGKYTAVNIEIKGASTSTLIIANQDESKTSKHSITIDGKRYAWKGPYLYNEKS